MREHAFFTWYVPQPEKEFKGELERREEPEEKGRGCMLKTMMEGS